MAEGERRSYIIVREDGLLLHTAPVTLYEAWWLRDAYEHVENRDLRIRYLSEWGNVLDVSGYLERLERLDRDLYLYVATVYEDPDTFVEIASKPLANPLAGPEARRVVEELAGEVREFLARPVEPRPVDAPARYFETPYMHVAPGPGGVARARPEWYAYKEFCCTEYAGISVFRDSFWLWRQVMYGADTIQAVVVRRDASDGDVIGAVAGDGAVLGLLDKYAERFRQLISEREAEMRGRGYGDVARKAKMLLAMLELLKAGRREEALPA